MNKQKLRQHLLNLRQNMSLKEVENKSNKITALILKHFSFKKNDKIFIYAPIKNEVNTWPLISYFWQNQVLTYFPKCDQIPGQMHFYQVKKKSKLTHGKFGILEPNPTCPLFTGYPPKIIFLPGVGFDLKKYRLGYGGGYYDRFLNNPLFKNSLLIGLAFEIQIVKTLPIEEWDKKLNLIITAKRVYQ